MLSIYELEKAVDECLLARVGGDSNESRDFVTETCVNALRLRSGDEEANVFASIRVLGNAGLTATRAGNRTDGRRAFVLARLIAREKRGHSDAIIAASCFLDSQIAYFRYKRDEPSRAEALLRRAFVRSVHRQGAEVHRTDSVGLMLAFHRVQLLNNLMRIRLRQSDLKSALRIAVGLLLFIEMGNNALLLNLPEPWTLGWSPVLSHLPTNLVTEMHNQISSEIVAMARTVPNFGRIVSEEAERLFEEKFDPLHSDTQSMLWILFTHAEFHGATSQMQTLSERIVRLRTVCSAPLRCSVLFALIQFANRSRLDVG